MRLRYSALSDVGRVRRDNQDAGYAGPHLLVIADGVGGSARGDVASSATVEQLRRLDGPGATRPQTTDTGGVDQGELLLQTLAGAIHRSHDRIAELVEASPEIDGTSTTVTAALFDGTRFAIGHVGDSRGYLFRAGQLTALTTDHTFVQSLIDEGRITEEEARVHPHRNLILRAVDGVHEPEPDMSLLEVQPGDRLLLCSDGCSGVLTDQQLAHFLGEGSVDSVAVDLVRASLDAGSSDNVTVILADVVADEAPTPGDDPGADATVGPMLVGAAAEGPGRTSRGPQGRTIAPVHTDTGELDAVGAEGEVNDDDTVDPEAIRYAPRPPRRYPWLRRVGLLLLALAAAGLVGSIAYDWSQRQYYVSNSGNVVVIYRGVEADLPGITMRRVAERSTLTLDSLPTYNARQVRDGISANSLTDARGIIARLHRLEVCSPVPETTAPPSPSGTPTGTPSGTPTGPQKTATPGTTPGSAATNPPAPGTTLTPSAEPTLPAHCTEAP